MKRFGLLLALCAPLAFSQQSTPVKSTTNLIERVQAPTYSDIYCAGFISKQPAAKSNLVIAGAESPDQTQFYQGDTVFLDGGGLQEGSRLSVVRELRDPNQSASYAGQVAAIAAVGQPYADLGRVRVTAIRGKTAIALVEFSCSPIVPGDLVVPFQEKAPLAFRGKTSFRALSGRAG